jgi:hypothetical protein
MIDTLIDLAHDDLGVYSVALVFFGMALGMALLAIGFAWDRQQEPTVSRPTSSSRKAGRVGGAS